jgi:hypothetical protein
METQVQCPYCGEEFETVIDLSVDGAQTYIEDCFVCCRPIQFRVEVADGEAVSVDTARS